MASASSTTNAADEFRNTLITTQHPSNWAQPTPFVVLVDETIDIDMNAEPVPGRYIETLCDEPGAWFLK
jgi:hypothetical protein